MKIFENDCTWRGKSVYIAQQIPLFFEKEDSHFCTSLIYSETGSFPSRISPDSQGVMWTSCLCLSNMPWARVRCRKRREAKYKELRLSPIFTILSGQFEELSCREELDVTHNCRKEWSLQLLISCRYQQDQTGQCHSCVILNQKRDNGFQ